MERDEKPDARPKRACPICGEPSASAFRPFCSKRCADIDLSRWLTGAYAIAGTEDDDEDGAADMPGFKGGPPQAANDDHADEED